MRAGELLFDFISLMLILGLIIFGIVVVIHGDNFETIIKTIEYSAPIPLFIIFYLIKSRLDRAELKKRTKEGNLDIVLRLTFFDKITLNVILFSSPIILLLIPLWAGETNWLDVLQATIVFFTFYFWQKYLFNKDTL